MIIGIHPENDPVQLALGPNLGPVAPMIIPYTSGCVLAHCPSSLTITQEAGYYHIYFASMETRAQRNGFTSMEGALALGISPTFPC